MIGALHRTLAVLSIATAVAVTKPVCAQGQAPATVEAAEQVFRVWMEKNGITSATLSIAHDDRLVFTRGYGGVRPEAPGVVASLSKAITAVCVGTLVDAGKLTFETTVGDVLADYFKVHGEPADSRLKNATITHLLAHRAGFDRVRGRDPVNMTEYLKTRSPREPDMAGLLKATLSRPLFRSPGIAYRYTNAPYLMLGVIIEAVTGRLYENYCRETVLNPLDIKGATLHPDWKVLASAAGWRLSGPQILAFYRVFDPESALLGPETRRYLNSGQGKWEGDQQSIYYALGTHVRVQPGGRHDIWHNGALRYNGNTVDEDNVHESVGTFATRYADGTSWFASFSPLRSNLAVAWLDREMARTLAAVKEWPDRDGFPALGLK